ncbi:MAG: dienelactone hydrolase family protein [Deltaproteobacteria bacterium]|nr:dienelactone hydrolase family protein [Deltaproteobacteria bacterium]
MIGRPVRVRVDGVALEGDLSIPDRARGVVLFAHGSGSSRLSPRNRYVAGLLGDAGFATLLIDLLTEAEEETDAHTGRLRFDVTLLANRLIRAADWLAREPDTASLPLGLFGASTGAAAALVAAARQPLRVRAVVSRGGRPDLAGPSLDKVRAATLLIVGGRDDVVLELNRHALDAIRSDKRIEVVQGATHLFPEPGALEEVARLATAWFQRHL